MTTFTPARDAGGSRARQMLNKVPEVTLYFWIIKVLCTTVGETASDYLADNLNLGLTKTTLITGALLIATLVFQFRARRYVPGIYWLADRPDQRRRHADHGQPDRQPRRLAGDDHDRLHRRARGGLRRLVRERANPLDPHDLHDAPRGLLLAGRPLHVRARHGCRRPDGRAAQPRLLRRRLLLFARLDRARRTSPTTASTSTRSPRSGSRTS